MDIYKNAFNLLKNFILGLANSQIFLAFVFIVLFIFIVYLLFSLAKN